MTKNSLTILLFVLLFVGGILYVEYAVPKIERVVHGPAIPKITLEPGGGIRCNNFLPSGPAVIL